MANKNIFLITLLLISVIYSLGDTNSQYNQNQDSMNIENTGPDFEQTMDQNFNQPRYNQDDLNNSTPKVENYQTKVAPKPLDDGYNNVNNSQRMDNNYYNPKPKMLQQAPTEQYNRSEMSNDFQSQNANSMNQKRNDPNSKKFTIKPKSKKMENLVKQNKNNLENDKKRLDFLNKKLIDLKQRLEKVEARDKEIRESKLLEEKNFDQMHKEAFEKIHKEMFGIMNSAQQIREIAANVISAKERIENIIQHPWKKAVLNKWGHKGHWKRHHGGRKHMMVIHHHLHTMGFHHPRMVPMVKIFKNTAPEMENKVALKASVDKAPVKLNKGVRKTEAHKFVTQESDTSTVDNRTANKEAVSSETMRAGINKINMNPQDAEKDLNDTVHLMNDMKKELRTYAPVAKQTYQNVQTLPTKNAMINRAPEQKMPSLAQVDLPRSFNADIYNNMDETNSLREFDEEMENAKIMKLAEDQLKQIEMKNHF